MVEIAALIPGGFMNELALYSSGVNMIDVAIKLALGEKLTIRETHFGPTYSSVVVRFLTKLDFNSEIVRVKR